MAFDFIVWQGINSNDVTNLIVKKNISWNYPDYRYEENYVAGNNDCLVKNNGVSMRDITVQFFLTGTPSYAGYTGRQALDLFFTGIRGGKYKNKLILSMEIDRWYEAYIVKGFSVDRLLDTGSMSVTFRCQGYARRLATENDDDSYDEFHPCHYERVKFGTDLTYDVVPYSKERKPKVAISFENYVAVMSTAITVQFSSQTTDTGYFGRRYTIYLAKLRDALQVQNPVLIFDFENDDFYVVPINENASGLEYYFNKKHSAGSIVNYMINVDSVGNSRDLYYDASTDSASEEPVEMWHNIRFRGYADKVNVSHYTGTGNLYAHIYYFPEERFG